MTLHWQQLWPGILFLCRLYIHPFICPLSQEHLEAISDEQITICSSKVTVTSQTFLLITHDIVICIWQNLTNVKLDKIIKWLWFNIQKVRCQLRWDIIVFCKHLINYILFLESRNRHKCTVFLQIWLFVRNRTFVPTCGDKFVLDLYWPVSDSKYTVLKCTGQSPDPAEGDHCQLDLLHVLLPLIEDMS